MADNLPDSGRQPDDINQWLRSVRPATPADDDWAGSPQAAELLAAVHRQLPTQQATEPATRKTATHRTAFGRVYRRSWLAAGAGLAAAAVLAAFLVPGQHSGSTKLAVPPPQKQKQQHPLTIRPAAMLLDNYSSCPQLLDDLRSHTAASVTPYGLPGLSSGYAMSRDLALAPMPKTAEGLDQSATAPANAGTATSTTNVQEVGVDEPDIVKTDNGRLISITAGTLRVVDAASKRVTGMLDLSIYAGWQGAQLLVSGDHALVVLGSDVTDYGRIYSLVPKGFAPGNRSSYLFVDLSGQPKVTGSMRATGSYLDARLIGSTVRLVVHSSPTLTFPTSYGTSQSLQANQRVVRQAPLAAWLPSYTVINGNSSSTNTVPCQQISHPAQYTGASMLTVYTLDLNQPATDLQPVSVTADGDTVYATAGSLYIASNPNWYCCTTTDPAQRTEIHRFDISGTARPLYIGSGSVPGRLQSRYSLSDYAGSLRIATTSGQDNSGLITTNQAETSSVYVLNSNSLNVTGQLHGLGTTEQIYAVRFVGPMAYVVTFRQTDPLYVIDLHNPTAPKLAGTLQLTGYSNYLHDVGNSRLIGVGQEASAAGRVAGLQVSLFDVSTPGRPVRTGHVVRSDAPGEQALDPHAFLYWQPTGLVVVPVQSWEPAQSGKVLVLRVSGSTLSTVGLLANPLTPGVADDGLGIQRSMLIDGALWTVSSSGVQVSNPNSLTRQAWIPFS
ncbi:MAG TPA: beta-propeller domain-containing protein [Jatrophihabitans sp.]|nr:beta-propeller domain-containing protein [Jatrophihabitans sp.]